jgi:hypothetical protein
MNKQPFYHRMEILFTATEDLSDEMNAPKFQKVLAQFLKENFVTVRMNSVTYDAPVDAEPGDPSDLVGVGSRGRR